MTPIKLPNELHHRLDGILHTLRLDNMTWYALDDSRLALCDCMARHEAEHSWNDGIVADLTTIERRIEELRPMLQPLQIQPDQPGAKPAETDPHITEDRIGETAAIADELEALLASEEAEATLDQSAMDTLTRETAEISETSAAPHGDEKRFPRLRRAVKGLVYALGGMTAAVTGGVVVNLLTAPEAAITLANRLQPLLERLLSLFY